MSSTAAPFGLRPIGRLDSGSLEVSRQYPIASGYGTAICVGDIVQLVDGGTATTIEKQSATGDDSTAIDMVGIFMGCKYTCLLYTSPSPRDGLLSRMPSSA